MANLSINMNAPMIGFCLVEDDDAHRVLLGFRDFSIRNVFNSL